LSSELCKYTHFFTINLAVTNKLGDGEKLLTHLNSALKGLLGLDIFTRVPKKKKLNFVDQCNWSCHIGQKSFCSVAWDHFIARSKDIRGGGTKSSRNY